MKKLILILSIFSLSSVLFAQLDRSKAPGAQPNPEIKINTPQPLKFDNGLKVIMVENHKLPKVSFQLFVDYPTPVEGDKAGISSIFGQLLGSGTKTTPKDEFDKKIDYIGATFSSNSRGIFASSLKKHTPTLLKLISETILEPAFAQEDFDRIVSQTRGNLASIPSDPGSMSSNVSGIVNYGKDHPYGEVMTETTLDNIELVDVKEFYSKNFKPNDAYLVIVGDVDQKTVKEYIRDYFFKWEKGESLEKKSYNVPLAKGKNVYFVNKPGAVQSVINITHNIDLKPGHEDVLKLRLLNNILGGGSFSARLLANLREDKAYTYGCYSSISSDPLTGSFGASGNFRNEVTDSAIVQILGEITRITQEPVLDKELDLVKKSMTGAFARSLENPQTIARFALNTVRYNLPGDYYANYLLRLERITKEELLQVAIEYLSPDNINIVVVGNEDVADKLKVFGANGKVNFKNYYGEDAVMMKKPAAGVTYESILTNYTMKTLMVNSETELAEKINSIGSIETIAKAELKQFNATILSYSMEGAPNKTASYVKVKSPLGSQVQQKEWFDGTAGAQVAGGAEKSYEGKKLENKKKQSFPVAQYYYAKDESKVIELLGVVEVDDQEVYKLKISKKEMTDEFTYEYYSLKTGLLIMDETYTTLDEGDPIVAVKKYTNFKDVNGIYLPHTTEISAQGQSFTFETKSIVVSKKSKSPVFTGNFKKIKKRLKSFS